MESHNVCRRSREEGLGVAVVVAAECGLVEDDRMFVNEGCCLSLFVRPSLLARSGLRLVLSVASFNKQWSGEAVQKKVGNTVVRRLLGHEALLCLLFRFWPFGCPDRPTLVVEVLVVMSDGVGYRMEGKLTPISQLPSLDDSRHAAKWQKLSNRRVETNRASFVGNRRKTRPIQFRVEGEGEGELS